MRIIKPLLILSFISIVIFLSGEMFARYYIGLGSPPLSITHPRIEYLFKPDQELSRFGNHIIINQYGMRTEAFSSKKEKREHRIMVFGDSVVNGGNQTDHYALATTLLREQLQSKTHKEVIVGNVSAGSWGPGNWLAYVQEYGFFDADAVVLVVSSHDYADNPSFGPLNKDTHPTYKPVFALSEGLGRYLPRYIPQIGKKQEKAEKDRFSLEVSEKDVLKGLEDLRCFLELAKQNSQTVVVLQHWEESEVKDHKPKHGYYRIKEVCDQLRIPVSSLEPYFRQSINAGANPYRDNIHPNKVGQQLVAQAIIENLPDI